jgi:hypothetical protein
MNNDFENLQNRGAINSHEQNSYDMGYYNYYLDNYLPLKKVILDKLDNNSDPDIIRYLNAIRIYSYSIYENLWYGYVLSYSNFETIRFCINSQETELAPKNLFKNHLSSFSSAILNFGTCRDYYFVLLRISVNPDFTKEIEELKKTVMIQYSRQDTKKFESDVKSLTKDPDYLKLAKSFLESNSFRNFYAHRLRLLWWDNPKSSDDLFFQKEVYTSILEDNSDKWARHLLDIFHDAKEYENEIMNANKEDIVSSSEILQKNHDDLAEFINETFGFIINKIEKEIK